MSIICNWRNSCDFWLFIFDQVIEKPSPVRVSSLLTSRHLSQRRIRLPARKYYPKHDGPKVIRFAKFVP